MKARLAEIRRHPVKGLGAERLTQAELAPGRAISFDRTWAVAHGGSAWNPDRPDWLKRSNFVVVAQVPRLSRATAAYDEAAGRLTLAHPDHGALTVDPESTEGPEALTSWVQRIAGTVRPGPYRLARLPGGAAMTDTPDAHLSILSTRSLAVLSERAAAPLDRHRFRANLWLEGLEPWEEFDLVGREISVGPARLRVIERIERCAATMANPATGTRDVDIPGLLDDRYGHRDFGVAAQVIEGGRIAPGDPVSA